jgi:NADH:ubiquinone oxidoreductase subunit D
MKRAGHRLPAYRHRKAVRGYQLGASRHAYHRVDYLSKHAHNLVYALTVEKFCNWRSSEAQWLRVMLVELDRLNSHLVWLGRTPDISAMSMFFYCFREREMFCA